MKILRLLVSFVFALTFVSNSFGGARDSGSNNAKQGLISAASNVAMGAAMMKAYGVSCAKMTCIFPLLAMGLLSYANAGASGGAAGQSYGAAQQLDYCPPPCNLGLQNNVPNLPGDGTNPSFNFGNLDPNTNIPSGPYNTLGDLQTAMNNLKDQFDKTGFIVDPANSKIISPDGIETSFAAVNAMAATGEGLSPEQYAATQSALAAAQEQIKSDFKVSSTGFENLGGGAGSVNAGSYNYDGLDMQSSLDSYLKKLKGNRKPAAVAGMKKVIAGNEAIGVAGDNIFDMIHRRYQHKRKANIFIEYLSPEKKQ